MYKYNQYSIYTSGAFLSGPCRPPRVRATVKSCRVRIFQDKNGCLVIQEALESATWEMHMPIMTELKGKVYLG